VVARRHVRSRRGLGFWRSKGRKSAGRYPPPYSCQTRGGGAGRVEYPQLARPGPAIRSQIIRDLSSGWVIDPSIRRLTRAAITPMHACTATRMHTAGSRCCIMTHVRCDLPPSLSPRHRASARRSLASSIGAAPPPPHRTGARCHDLIERAEGTCGQWSNEPDRLPGPAPRLIPASSLPPIPPPAPKSRNATR
jgi:hypothetical protein